MTPARGSALRVSFVVDSESWGGAEVWLGHHLRRAAEHGVDASVVCAEPLADRVRAEAPAGRLAVVPLARHLPTAPATRDALVGQTPDVVVVNLVDPGSNAATVAAALEVAPTAAVLHLTGEVAEEERARLAELYARLAVLITTSSDGVELVHRRLAEPRHGVVVSCNGVDVPPDPHGPAGHQPPRIGGFGRLTRQKGYDVLLEATRLLGERGHAFEVGLGGAGREEAALRAAAEGLPVRFTGWVSDPRVFLADLDLFCLPSRHEALPLALLEAMAEGLPCVATDVGDVRDRLGDVVEVVAVEDAPALADALAALLADGVRRERAGAAARRRVEEHHDADQMVTATYEVLREVVSTW